MTTDPFEEFEFKPLTEGLGFHQKIRTAADLVNEELSSTSSVHFKNTLPEIEMPATTSRRTLADLPKAKETGATSVDEILKTLQNKRKFEFQDSQKQLKQTPSFYQQTTHDFSALVLDGMLVTAGSLGCLIVLLLTTHVDLFAVMTKSNDWTLNLTLGLLLASVAGVYLVLNRVFLGFTPGEWVFDQRIGLPDQQGTSALILRTLARTGLIMLTGLVTLPLLSIITGQDLAGQISGASLFRKK